MKFWLCAPGALPCGSVHIFSAIGSLKESPHTGTLYGFLPKGAERRSNFHYITAGPYFSHPGLTTRMLFPCIYVLSKGAGTLTLRSQRTHVNPCTLERVRDTVVQLNISAMQISTYSREL